MKTWFEKNDSFLAYKSFCRSESTGQARSTSATTDADEFCRWMGFFHRHNPPFYSWKRVCFATIPALMAATELFMIATVTFTFYLLFLYCTNPLIPTVGLKWFVAGDFLSCIICSSTNTKLYVCGKVKVSNGLTMTFVPLSLSENDVATFMRGRRFGAAHHNCCRFVAPLRAVKELQV